MFFLTCASNFGNVFRCFTDFSYYYNLIRSTKREYLETGNAAKEFLNKDFKEKYKVFQRYIAAADDAKGMLSERVQDPAWFEGIKLLSYIT